MKPKINPLVRQLTDSVQPDETSVISKPVKRIVENRRRKPAKKQDTDDDIKREAIGAYASDWRLMALHEFNQSEGTNFELADDESTDAADYMQFEDNRYIYWYIYRTDDTAEKYAVAQVTDDLNDDPSNFNQDWLSGHIDQKTLKYNLWQDVQEHRREDFNEMRQQDKIEELKRANLIDDDDIYVTTKAISRNYQYPAKKREEAIATYVEQSSRGLVDAIPIEDLEAMDDEDLVKLLIAAHIVDEDDAYEEDQVEREDLDEFLEDKVDDYIESLEADFNPMDWLEEIFGGSAIKEAIKIAGINVEEAAQEAVNTDGWAHFLARGENTYELPSGAVYFKL